MKGAFEKSGIGHSTIEFETGECECESRECK